MEKVNKQRRWILSLVIIGVVLVASVALILTNLVPSERIILKAISDGSGGTFVVWYQNQGIHVQQVGSDGNLLWSKEVVLEDTKLKQPEHFALADDGQGGVIVTWGDMSVLGNDSDDPSYFNPVPVYSQRLNASGELLWGKGVPTGAGEHHGLALTLPQVMPDGAGGAYILCNNFKPAFKALHDDYFRLQRLDSQGKPVWEEPGKLLFSSPPFHATTPEEKAQGEKGTVTRSWPLWTDADMVSDGQGGTIVVWKEETQHRYANIRAQRYDASGKSVWQEDGVLIYSAWDGSIQVTGDGDGGAIIVIGVGRQQESSGSANYSVQRITAEGKLLWPDAGVLIKGNLRPWGSIEVMIQGTDIIVLWQEIAGSPEIIDGRPVQQIALYAERISAEGKTVWQRAPVFYSEAGESFGNLVMCNDDEGVLLAWRSGGREQWEGKVFAQKITAEGRLAREENSVTVFGGEFQYQGSPVVVSDGSGGAIILAAVGKNPLGGDMVYAQRLDASGNAIWGEGIKVSR